jgi:hypothetical protein
MCIQVLAVSVLIEQSFDAEKDCLVSFPFLKHQQQNFISLEFQRILNNLLEIQSNYKTGWLSWSKGANEDQIQSLVNFSMKTLYPFIHKAQFSTNRALAEGEVNICFQMLFLI